MKQVLITGAAGELGQALVHRLSSLDIGSITCLDLLEMPIALKKASSSVKSKLIWKQASITDQEIVTSLIQDFDFDTVFHMAALLSASAARDPLLAQRVNIDAAKHIINCTLKNAEEKNKLCRLIFPSSIAVYGMDHDSRKNPVTELFRSTPITLYGKQKLEIEDYGLKISSNSKTFDFRILRFPGIISADTVPVGGTSDYASLMAHNAAKNEAYSCFVLAPTTLSFISMPDAVEALIMLACTDKLQLHQHVYNLHGFSASAQEIADYTKYTFPNSKISFAVNLEKQQIVDSWPAIVDCSAFCKDTGWEAKLNKEDTFFKYLFPKIAKLYSRGS